MHNSGNSPATSIMSLYTFGVCIVTGITLITSVHPLDFSASATAKASPIFASKTHFFLLPDKGSENVEVGRLMEEKHGKTRGSWLTGSSVHNQRIER